MAPDATSPTWFTGRTRIITIVSLIAVVLAGATAVSANIGILHSAADSSVGDATVIGDLSSAVTTDADSGTSSVSGAGYDVVKTFAVDSAGTVTVTRADTGLRLDHVVPTAGWSWTLRQSDSAALTLTMANESRMLVFAAMTTPNGDITASVSEAAGSSGQTVQPVQPHDDDDDRDGHHEHFEGRDDDD